MSAQIKNSADEGDDSQIISPFAQTTSSIRPIEGRTKSSWLLWMVSCMLIIGIMGNAGYFIFKYINDPYRTLELFSVDKYYADFLPLTGSKFKAEMKVSADLGWKESTGRLMVFTVGSDTRPIGVLIPPKLSGIFFSKGQTYQISLEVSEGGLLYADSCDKE